MNYSILSQSTTRDAIHALNLFYYIFNCQPHKMAKHTQTTRRQQPTNCSSVLDHFVGLALKGLSFALLAINQSRTENL